RPDSARAQGRRRCDPARQLHARPPPPRPRVDRWTGTHRSQRRHHVDQVAAPGRTRSRLHFHRRPRPPKRLGRHRTRLARMTPAAPDLTILRALLDAGDGFVSGNALARELGVSRVSVWQHMEKLRDQGFGFEAIRSRGYRLTAKPAALNAALIAARLPAALDCRIVALDTVDSTNDEAMRLVSQGASTPLVVIAAQQTRGRGRMGREWLSEPNG